MRIIATVSDPQRVGVLLDLLSGGLVNIWSQAHFHDQTVRGRSQLRPFGITWSDTELLIANNKQILAFDRMFRYVRTCVDVLETNVHQLSYHLGCVWGVSPWTNSLIIVDPIANRRSKEYDLLEATFCERRETSLKEHDLHHFNSLLFTGDRLFVAAHNHSQPSFILEIDAQEFALVKTYADVGAQIHGLAYTEGELWWISTGSLEIRSSFGRQISLFRPGYSRGFALTKDYFIVATSDVRSRARRWSGDSFIHVIDRGHNTLEAEYLLKDTGGVNDLRVLDCEDFAHHLPPFLLNSSIAGA